MTTYLGKSCSFGLLRVPFVNCRQFMYLVISLLILRAGSGIWLYQFLIIAYLYTLLAETTWYDQFSFLWMFSLPTKELIFFFLFHSPSRSFIWKQGNNQTWCKYTWLDCFESSWAVMGTATLLTPPRRSFIWKEGIINHDMNTVHLTRLYWVFLSINGYWNTTQINLANI